MGKRQHHQSHHPNDETPEERIERKRSKNHAKSKDASAPTTTVTSTGNQQSQQQQSQSSLYYNKKLQLSVSILPCGLRNVEQSAKESIRPLLLKYCNPMGGILLAYDNVQVAKTHDGVNAGMILNELPHVHYNITCNALVFCPTVGLRLDGTVVEASFHSHLVLVVHEHFNASISAQHLRACGFAYDNSKKSCWYHVESCQYLGEHGNGEQVDDQDQDEVKSSSSPISRIQFTLEKLHEVGGIISMDGSDPSLLLV